MLRYAVALSSLLVTTDAPSSEPVPASRQIGQVLGWDVVCAVSLDGRTMTSCGLTLEQGDLKILVGVSRTVSYTVSKGCGHPHHYWIETGLINSDGDISMLLSDVATAAQFDGKIRDDTCKKTDVPPADVFQNLATLLMMLRTFPPSSENKGILFE